MASQYKKIKLNARQRIIASTISSKINGKDTERWKIHYDITDGTSHSILLGFF